MRRVSPLLLTLAALLTGVPAGLWAQTAPNAAPAQSAAASDRRLSELFYQLQVLQQEVQELRGLVEEQSFQLNRLARDQQEQYIDLDGRIAQLTTGGTARPAGSAAGGTGGTSSGALSAGGLSGTTTSPSAGGTTVPGGVAALPGAGATGAGVPAGVSERDAYQQAFDLMKARNFDQSVEAFNRLIVSFPNGQYTPNALYWLGELYLAQQNTEQARQSFMQVLSLYPDHPKVPDTLYKLGVAYHRLGDVDRAMEYFRQVQSEYPQSSAAGLATSYAQEIR
jgi:tol-pal system protein YbgF